MVTGHRENVRWERERDDRQKQWEREDQARGEQWERERDDRQKQWQREDSLRWQEERQQAYARLIAALYEWDNALRWAVATRENEARFGEGRGLDTAEIERRATAARETLALVQLMAPKRISALASRAIGDRGVFRITHLEAKPIDLTHVDAGWKRLLERRSELLAAMQENLGLEMGHRTT